jgi:signal transduction histidine kinase
VVLGALLAVLALVAAGSRRRRSELLASTALALASIPYVVYQNVPVGSVIVAAGGIAPAVWLVRWGSGRNSVGRVVAVGAVGLAVAWAALRAARVEAAIPVGQAGALALAVGAVLMLAIGTGLTPGRVLRVIATTRVLDLAVLAGGVLAAVGLVAAGVPLPLLALAVLLPLLAYARARAGIASLVERTLLADMRERESIRATEEERARMSREIHDDPLQALAGVIRRLEQPDADVAGARDSLRDVADRLRSVATELHPPVLDDLGLAPAIDAGARLLTQGAGPEAPEIQVRIANQTGYTRAERAPADVELAVYRITQEAMENAVHHAEARHVTVRGTIAAARIDVEIEDDGRGINDEAMDLALRSGHLGIASMRRRADAIDARLEIDGAPESGTRVRLRWSA